MRQKGALIRNVNLKEKYRLLIGGQWRGASDGGAFKTYDPATGELLAVCAEATGQDVDDAVKAAWAAFPAWKAVQPQERAAILHKIADRIDENAEPLGASRFFVSGQKEAAAGGAFLLLCGRSAVLALLCA